MDSTILADIAIIDKRVQEIESRIRTLREIILVVEKHTSEEIKKSVMSEYADERGGNTPSVGGFIYRY